MKRILTLFLIILSALFFSVLKINGLETTEEELKKGFVYEEDYLIEDEDYEYEINKICRHDNGYIVVGKAKDTEELIPHLAFYITYPYIAFYNENGKQWSKLDKAIGHGEYCDAIVKGNEVVAIGTYETGDEVARLLVTRFNESGNIKARVPFDHNKTTFGKRILYENNELFLVGTTNATHFISNTEAYTEKIFVLKLNSSYQAEKIKFIYNQDLSRVTDACMANGTIYIQGNLNGTGNYNIETDVLSFELFSLDTNLTHLYYNSFPRQKNMKIACNEDGLYLFMSDDYLNTFTICELDIGMDIIRSIRPFNSSTQKLDSFTVGSSSLHEPVSCYITSSEGDDIFSNYLSIDLSLKIKNLLTKKEATNKVAGGIFIIDGFYYTFSNLDLEKDVKKLVYIKQEDGLCYCNGILCQYEKESIEESVFGTYKQKVTYYYGNFEIITYEDYTIPLNISIRDKSVYDRRVILTFNGVGYLNNERIDSGYIVSELGQYVLEVRGKDETKFFTFEVKNLVTPEDSFTLEEPTISFDKDTGTIITQIVDNDTSNYSSSISLNNFTSEQETNYYIVIAIVLIGLFGGLLVPFEKMKRKEKEETDE